MSFVGPTLPAAAAEVAVTGEEVATTIGGSLGDFIKTFVTLVHQFLTPPAKVALPEDPTADPNAAAQASYAGTYSFLTTVWGLPWWLAAPAALQTALIVFIGAEIFKIILWAIATIGVEIAEAGIQGVDLIRQKLDVGAAGVGVLAMNELLGTDLNIKNLATSTDFEGHTKRARTTGKLLMDVLVNELSVPDLKAKDVGINNAELFTGLMINFGAATGLIGLLGQFASVGLIDQFRSIGEEVARNLGLGRLTRQALHPITNILINTPMTWDLHKKYRPTQLGVAEIANPFLSGTLNDTLVHETLELAGYSDKIIHGLLALYKKKVPESAAEALVRWGAWSKDDAIKYIEQLGYAEDVAQVAYQIEVIKRADTRVTTLVSDMETAYVAGHIDEQEFDRVLGTLPLEEGEVKLIQMAANYKRRVPSKVPSIANLELAFEDGYIDQDEFEGALRAQGYSNEDTGLLVYLTLTKLKKTVEAGAAKVAKAKAKAAKAAAKAALPATKKRKK